MEKKRNYLKLLRNVSFIAFTFVFIACNSKEKAKIKISIPELSNATGFIEEQRVSGAKFLDSANFSSSGNYSYKVDLDQPTFYNLRVPKHKDIFLILHPGDKVSLSGSLKALEISGSDDSKKLNILYDSLFSVRKTLSDLRSDFEHAASEEEKTNISNKYEATIEGYRRFSLQTILSNLSSMVSLAAIYQEIGPNEYLFAKNKDLQYYKLVNDSLSKLYPKHRHVLALMRNFNSMMGNYNAKRILSSAKTIEEGIPELTLPDLTGRQVAMLKQNKKYILLNFWSEQIERIPNFFPDLKNIHNRFGTKGFDIYNVYLGPNRENKWENTVKFEEIQDFINVADTNFPGSKTQMAFNVVRLPANYLIDISRGEIVGKDLNLAQLQRSLAIKLE